MSSALDMMSGLQSGSSGSEGGSPGAPDNPQSEEFLATALKALQDFMGSEEDHVDKALISKCMAQIQGLLGGRQKDAESALGVTPAHKAMSRAAY